MSFILTENILDNLAMCIIAHDFNPKLFEKKIANPFSRNEKPPVLDHCSEFVSVVCISALFSGTRFYLSNKRYNIYGSQGVESFDIKSKEMRKFYELYNEVYYSLCDDKSLYKEVTDLIDFTERPIHDFGLINTDVFIYFVPDQQQIVKRIYIEWYGLVESSLEYFMHFYNYASRLRDGIKKLEELKINHKEKFKGDGVIGRYDCSRNNEGKYQCN